MTEAINETVIWLSILQTATNAIPHRWPGHIQTPVSFICSSLSTLTLTYAAAEHSRSDLRWSEPLSGLLLCSTYRSTETEHTRSGLKYLFRSYTLQNILPYRTHSLWPTRADLIRSSTSVYKLDLLVFGSVNSECATLTSDAGILTDLSKTGIFWDLSLVLLPFSLIDLIRAKRLSRLFPSRRTWRTQTHVLFLPTFHTRSLLV